MARDILAVPISTAASESAFSTGRRVLDVFRSSLTPKNIEALVYIQDWLRFSKELISIEEALDELEKFEKGVFLLAMHCFIIIYFILTFWYSLISIFLFFGGDTFNGYWFFTVTSNSIIVFVSLLS